MLSKPWGWLIIIALLGFATYRYLAPVTGLLLGSTVTCGNVAGWTSGADRGANGVVATFCAGQLSGDTKLAFIAGVAGGLLTVLRMARWLWWGWAAKAEAA